MADQQIHGEPHSVCPRCGSTDTYWNDSQADPDDDSAVFLMHCDGCHKEYTSIFRPAYKCWDDEDDH